MYKYQPNWLDFTDPRVIAGKAITPGQIVKITKNKIDPCGLFVFIEDQQGNRQSVYKKSLTKI
jgi:hypothetical protein